MKLLVRLNQLNKCQEQLFPSSSTIVLIFSSNYNRKIYNVRYKYTYIYIISQQNNYLNQLMDQELQRILQSDLNSEITQSINTNQSDIHRMQQILNEKNSQVYRLQKLIEKQLEITIKERQISQKCGNAFKRGLSKIKAFKGQLKPMRTQIKSIRQQFMDMGQWLKYGIKSINQSMSKVQVPPIINTNSTDYGRQSQNHHKNTQTQEEQAKKNIQSKLLDRVEKLESLVISLKQQKYKLTKQVQKYQKYYEEHQNKNTENQNRRNLVAESEYYSGSSIQSVQAPQLAGNLFQNTFFINITYEQLLTQQNQTKFKGNIINKIKMGYGVCQYSNKFSYEGNFMHGKKVGLGVLKYENNIIYRGYWRQDKFHGKGQLRNPQSQGTIQKISGEFYDGKIDGYGTIFYTNGHKIRAIFKQGNVSNISLLDRGEECGIHTGIMINEDNSYQNSRFESHQTRQIFVL